MKCSLYFRGRENDHREFGFDVMNRVIGDVKDLGSPEQMPRMIGRNLMMLLTPIKSSGGGGRKKEDPQEEATEKAPAGEKTG